jgi:hypothetical protein
MVELPQAAAPEEVDISTTVSPDVLIESNESFVSADGKILRYQFNWQNPFLLPKIYPFRNEKLRDFLLYFSEIDLVNQYDGKTEDSPEVKQVLDSARAEIAAKRADVLARWQKKMDEYMADTKDPYNVGFKKVSSQTNLSPEGLTFRQKYYLDYQVIRRLEDKINALKDEQNRHLKKAGWWEKDSVQYNKEMAEADNCAKQIVPLQAKQDQAAELLDLFNQKAQVADTDLDLKDVLHWEIEKLKDRWPVDPDETDMTKVMETQNKLLGEIINWINREPDRFPEWLVYMVIHFSGMKYMSSHSSYAEPRDLLELLKKEDISEQVASIPFDQLKPACLEEATRWVKRPAPSDPTQKREYDNITRRLNLADRNALKEAKTTEVLDQIKALENDAACLAELERYRQQVTPPMPAWVWAEICKYTPLRLQTKDPNWDATLQDRWQPTKKNWLSVMNTWETKDVTSWRKKHAETLDLIVTRAVCNEIAEQIQNLRGVAPVAGLAARPKWYIRRAGDDPKRAYFHQAPDERDFRSGASILWLEWVDLPKPNPWQIASPITGYTLPGQKEVAQPVKHGEPKKRKKPPVNLNKQDDEGWDYIMSGNNFMRQRDIFSDDPKKPGKVVGKHVQWLRWRHEATVVGVFDMVDGKYVMTFETGNIGLRLRTLSGLAYNNYIFVGYVPQKPLPPPKDPNDKPTLDDRLVNMLRWDRILPGTKTVRTRPKFVEDPIPEETKPGTATAQALPQRPVVVVSAENQRDIRLYSFAQKDKQGSPKMQKVTPLVWLEVGTRLSVATAYTGGLTGPGNGVVKASGNPEFFQENLYLLITECADEPRAVGLYIHLNHVADLEHSKTVQVIPQEKGLANVQLLKFRNKQHIPVMQLLRQEERDDYQLPNNTQLKVSTIHKAGFKDNGDGVLITDGELKFYVVLDCPTNPNVEGYYIPLDLVKDVPG